MVLPRPRGSPWGLVSPCCTHSLVAACALICSSPWSVTSWKHVSHTEPGAGLAHSRWWRNESRSIRPGVKSRDVETGSGPWIFLERGRRHTARCPVLVVPSWMGCGGLADYREGGGGEGTTPWRPWFYPHTSGLGVVAGVGDKNSRTLGAVGGSKSERNWVTAVVQWNFTVPFKNEIQFIFRIWF